MASTAAKAAAAVLVAGAAAGIVYAATQQGAGTSKTPPPATPSLSVSTTTTTVTSILGILSYSPGNTGITGHNFTPKGTVNLYDENNDLIIAFTATASGDVLGNISFAGYAPAVGTGYLYLYDTDTGASSNQVTMTYQAAGGGGGGGSTTQPGYVLAPSGWTGTGAYGSNTNPVSWGNWAVVTNSIWGVNFYGAGYYQNPYGSQEMHFAGTSDAVNWLTAHGYQVVIPVATGLSVSATTNGLQATVTATLAGATISTGVFDWGDGQKSSVPALALGKYTASLSHVYAAAGTYSVLVSVTDSSYVQHQQAASVTVSGSAPSTKPTLSVAGVPALGGTITFDVSNLTPDSTYLLWWYPAAGLPMAQQLTFSYQALDSAGSGSLPYDITSSTELEAAIALNPLGIYVYARDTGGVQTNAVEIK